jgi:hypothetical protein
MYCAVLDDYPLKDAEMEHKSQLSCSIALTKGPLHFNFVWKQFHVFSINHVCY